ncbi:hypothetical protein PSm6_13950 [Pseudomonas solani]|uniref:Uncharacterized protein n=1 Tax=Pseudomonas solani TaxID=2731552 RepID=A0ABM7L6B5_9PSED|nr:MULTISPECIES: hypothetical protein [Pseudomonas]WCD79826.1 hypothetical protein PI990_28205 [Pseudomonas sp. TUM22785]BCD84988.1 hypothetical protein PSm6_13950 [Pseudomonas solani]
MPKMPIPLPVNPSRWGYVTASGGGLTVAFVAGGGGSITLRSPSGENVALRYGGLGAGVGFGAKLPRFGKVDIKIKGKSVGGTGAAEAFPSDGAVFVADDLVDRDLTRDDITGPCMYVEVNAGVAVGVAGTAMLFGLDAKLLAAVMLMNASPVTSLTVSPMLTRQLMQSARGALLMGGANLGIQAGAGGAVYIGALF